MQDNTETPSDEPAAPLKSGDEILVSNREMMEGLVGRIVDIRVDGQDVRARIIKCSGRWTSLKIIPKNTKD